MEEYVLTLENIQQQEKTLKSEKINKLIKFYEFLLKNEKNVNEENIEMLVMKNLFNLKEGLEYKLNPELIYNTIQFFSNKKNKKILIEKLMNRKLIKEK